MEKKLPAALEQIVADFPTARPLRVVFQDEARFGRISRSRYCWAPRPSRPMVKTSLTHQYTYAYGAVSPLDGRFDPLILPHANTECMQLFINEVSSRYPRENLIMVADGAGWHRAKALKMPDNLRMHPLPPYSPELNPQEYIWGELREKFFHNRVFDSIDALEESLVTGLAHFEQRPDTIRSTTAWDWIINAISIAN